MICFRSEDSIHKARILLVAPDQYFVPQHHVLQHSHQLVALGEALELLLLELLKGLALGAWGKARDIGVGSLDGTETHHSRESCSGDGSADLLD